MDLNFYLINYNMNHQTDQNYEKLKKYIPQKNILILDNGSDKITPHKETKILLKENIKVSGAFRHIWDKEIAAKTKYVVTITSSATLLNYDYASAIKNDIKEMKDNWSAIYCKIESVDSPMHEEIPDQIGIDKWIKNPLHAQPIFTIWNVEYLKEIKNKKYGWYDSAYNEGQGATEDMRMYNLTSSWNEWCSPNFSVHWYRNNTFREGRGGMTPEQYYQINRNEFNKRFRQKYNMNHRKIINHLKKHRRT